MTGLETQLAEFIVTLVGMIADLTTIAWAAPLIVIFVALIKGLPWLKRIPATYLHLAVQVVFWALYVIFVKMGGDEAQFQDWTEGLTVILQTLLPLVASLFGATWLYEHAKAQEIPLLGYERGVVSTLSVEELPGHVMSSPAMAHATAQASVPHDGTLSIYATTEEMMREGSDSSW